MGILQVAIALTLVVLIALVSAGIPMARYEALMKGESQPELGLYNASDRVRILTNVNFNEEVMHKNRSILVEFYNSFCGHCKRFAPHYKDLASQLYGWRDVLPVGAIDCAAEENNGICREYEVMAYPTLRYMPPGFVPEPESYGRTIITQNIDEIRTQLAQWIAAENRTTNMTNWPMLQPLSEADTQTVLGQLNDQLDYFIVIYEPDNTTIGIETILNFNRWPNVLVRRVSDLDVASKLQIDGKKYKIAIIDSKGTIVPYSALEDSSKSYTETIKSILSSKHITERPDPVDNTTKPMAHHGIGESSELAQHNALLAEVLRNKHVVYQADLEMAIHGILYNEVPKIADISGDRLLALQRILAVLQRYNPLGVNGREMVKELNDFVRQHNQHLSGEQFEKEVRRLDKKYTPIFTGHRYVGCMASRKGLRGYSCSLWQLFHFFAAEAARQELSQDPLEVLGAMHGYVKGFFGCTNCAEHFQAMATRRKIWTTPNQDEVILWLWAAHNEVNQRLAGDETEDPKFPKIQFPTSSSCPECYRQTVVSPANLDINWNKDAVLAFLKSIHHPEKISRLGLDNEDQLFATADKLRQKRLLSNVFSDMDMRMGYRRKAYGHDVLGKV